MGLPDDLLNPIDGPSPGGADIRYEPVFDEIKEARREEDDVPQGDWEHTRKTADYPLVIKLATKVLAKQSKDLQVAAWLAEALLREEGIAGFRDGLALLVGLQEQFWDHLFPEIEDDDVGFRAAPLDWIGSSFPIELGVRSVAVNGAGHSFLGYKECRTLPTEDQAEGDEGKQATRSAAIEAGKVVPEAFDEGFESTNKAWYKTLVADLDACLRHVTALDTLGQERYGDEAPSFVKLRDTLGEVQILAKQLLGRKLELDPDPEPEMTGDGDDGGVGGEGGEPTAVPIEPTSADDAARRVAAAARFLQREDPTNPASYLLLRGFRWGELRKHGKDVNPKLLSAPPTPVRTRLKGLLLDAKWDELLAAGEGVMATAHGRGWLDLQRYVLTACESLGSEYDFVSSAIRGALVDLLHDLPQLPQQTLMDDTPTANSETRAWLRDLLAAEEAAGSVTVAIPDDDVAASPAEPAAAPARDVFDRAMALVRAGRPEKGIELLMTQAGKEKSARERFLRRSEAADIMVASGLDSVALPILRDLLQLIEDHKLESWEAGDTVARPLGLLFKCMRSVEGESDTTRDLYLRICRLDPIRAMAFGSGPDVSEGQTEGTASEASDGDAGW